MNRKLKEIVNQSVGTDGCGQAFGPEHVVILLAHYNGASMLPEQLGSLVAQTHRAWSLIISDDGSSDEWLKVASEFAASHPDHRTWLVSGPRKGFAQNFLSLVALAGPSVPYAAYCDQDDVWLPGKLARAVAALREVDASRPALYCARTMVCDRDLRPLLPSPHFRRPPGFANALVQNIGGGNTMVLNRAAIDLLQDTRRHAGNVFAHDWWAYQLISGAGGKIIYDSEPALLYRQHGGNSIGANMSFAARLLRLRQLVGGRFRAWNAINTAALGRVAHWLTPEAREMLTRFDLARNGNLRKRLQAVREAGLYRQTRRGQIALWAAAALKRL